MALRNRWIVRTVNPYTYDDTATHCVECRATNAVAFYGTLAKCKVQARKMNSPRATLGLLSDFTDAFPNSQTAQELKGF